MSRSIGPWMIAIPPRELGGSIELIAWDLRPDGNPARTQSHARARRWDSEADALRFVARNRHWFDGIGNPRVIDIRRPGLSNVILDDVEEGSVSEFRWGNE